MFGCCQQGYVACSLLLAEHHDLLRLIIQAIKNDLAGKNEIFQCLALVCIANVGGQEFAESLAPDVQKLLVAGYAPVSSLEAAHNRPLMRCAGTLNR